MILGPVASVLARKRLLIVADGALHYVPFAALPVPAAARPDSEKENQPAANRPAAQTLQPVLIQGHEIINLPSASSLAVLRKQLAGRKPAPKAVAVFADPVFDVGDPRVKASAKPNSQKTSSTRDQQAVNSAGSPDTSSQDISTLALIRSVDEIGLSDRGGLPRLPFTRQEAESIYAVTKQDDAMKALDFDANRETASSPDLSRYRIVHFATHGLLNNEHPELSGIVLSLVDKQGNPRNGFFRLVNVYNMNLSADLVVLSACQTALGKQIRGEGLVGLARGFMYAGAERVVASLWKVGDDATAELMKKFYDSMMKQGQRPAAALRSAQIWMAKQGRWRLPYYWAGFVLQGEWK
jgi:CHAT domain-containing protein